MVVEKAINSIFYSVEIETVIATASKSRKEIFTIKRLGRNYKHDITSPF